MNIKKISIFLGIIIAVLAILGFIRKTNNIFRTNINSFQSGSRDYKYSLTHNNLERHYKLHIPDGYNNDSKIPVVIYVHGGGGDMRAAYMDGLDKMADKHNFILAIPEGTGEKKLGHMRAVWNGGKWEGGECCGNADDVGFISKMIDEIKNNFSVDEKRIYVTGISNGGLMTNRVGCELADKVAAIATVAPAGLILNCSPSRPISIMNIHGMDDPANPIDGSEPKSIFSEESGTGFSKSYKRMTPYQVIDAWKKINKCSDNQSVGYQKGNTRCMINEKCLGNSEVELCIIDGMGHTYPSGSQYFPVAMVGSVSYDISFDQIWDFFQKHPST